MSWAIPSGNMLKSLAGMMLATAAWPRDMHKQAVISRTWRVLAAFLALQSNT